MSSGAFTTEGYPIIILAGERNLHPTVNELPSVLEDLDTLDWENKDTPKVTIREHFIAINPRAYHRGDVVKELEKAGFPITKVENVLI